MQNEGKCKILQSPVFTSAWAKKLEPPIPMALAGVPNSLEPSTRPTKIWTELLAIKQVAKN